MSWGKFQTNGGYSKIFYRILTYVFALKFLLVGTRQSLKRADTLLMNMMGRNKENKREKSRE